jgi:hypothetical protein
MEFCVAMQDKMNIRGRIISHTKSIDSTCISVYILSILGFVTGFSALDRKVTGCHALSSTCCWENQDRGRSDKFLELHEGVFLGQAPDEPNILHGQVKECARMMGEPRDEALVKINEADE